MRAASPAQCVCADWPLGQVFEVAQETTGGLRAEEWGLPMERRDLSFVPV